MTPKDAPNIGISVAKVAATTVSKESRALSPIWFILVPSLVAVRLVTAEQPDIQRVLPPPSKA